MKFIIQSYPDLHRLIELYLRGQVTADEYFAAVDEYSRLQIEAELKHERKMRKN